MDITARFDRPETLAMQDRGATRPHPDVTAVSAAQSRHQTTVSAGRGHALTVRSGQRVHIVNTLGHQVVDTWAVGLPTGQHRLSMSHTRLAIGRLSPAVGDVLVDDQRQPMLRLVADDSGGGHDTLIAACDPQRYRALGYEGFHASCFDNYSSAITGHGLPAPTSVPDPLNLFMAVPVSANGELTLLPSTAPPGGRVVVEALQDLLLVVSSCPQDLVPINGVDSAPRFVDLYLEDPAQQLVNP